MRHRSVSSLNSDAIYPDDSASLIGRSPPKSSPLFQDLTSRPLYVAPPTSLRSEFVFKFRDGASRKKHRITSSVSDLSAIKTYILVKISKNVAIEASCLMLSYIDDEGDAIQILSGGDLEDAVIMAESLGWRSLELLPVVKVKNPKRMLTRIFTIDGLQLAKAWDRYIPLVFGSGLVGFGMVVLARRVFLT